MFLDDMEMLTALYDFEATLAKTLSFTEGEFFFLQQSNTKQRNWWHVVNRKGHVGFVPSNYVAAVKVSIYFILVINTYDDLILLKITLLHLLHKL